GNIFKQFMSGNAPRFPGNKRLEPGKKAEDNKKLKAPVNHHHSRQDGDEKPPAASHRSVGLPQAKQRNKISCLPPTSR
ncbi:hypothetical protein K8353_50705, partial [Burkholderia contaminans]|nr:hypothetical protein [Burkholderia contaminans]